MTHLNPSEFHDHRTSCLSGGEFPCHVALDASHDTLFDAPALGLGRSGRPRKGQSRPILDPNGDFHDLCLQFGVNEGNLPARPSAAGKDHVTRKPQEAL